MGPRSALAATLTTTVIACFGSVPSSATLITFDNLVGGTSIGAPTPVTTQYAGLGVVFSDPSGPMGAVLGSVVEVTGYSPPMYCSPHNIIKPMTAGICGSTSR
jgi:hypothetical protein